MRIFSKSSRQEKVGRWDAYAIVIPHEAILKEGNQLFVEYRNMEGAAAERIAVKAGRVSAEGVEVFGLKPGYVRTMNRP